MKKIIQPGSVKVGQRYYKLYIEIAMDHDCKGRDVLRMHGAVGPLASGNCMGPCGQIGSSLDEDLRLAPGWTRDMVGQVNRVWNRWHLNDMRAGTPAQEACLRAHSAYRSYLPPEEILDVAGLLVDNGYEYGSRLLYEPLPLAIEQIIASWPAARTSPAWV